MFLIDKLNKCTSIQFSIFKAAVTASKTLFELMKSSELSFGKLSLKSS